jgi:hypothetical protein
VLLNGGVFHGAALSERLLDILGGWRGQAILRLDNPEPDLAVARGAVAYGLARRGQGLKIGGGSARSYFLVVDSGRDHRQGVCLLPRGAEEGQEIRLGRTFSLRLGAPVQFHLLSSTGDAVYRPGETVALNAETLTPLPPSWQPDRLRVRLPARRGATGDATDRGRDVGDRLRRG